MDISNDCGAFLYSLSTQPICSMKLNTSFLKGKINIAEGFNCDIRILKFFSNLDKNDEVFNWLYSDDVRLLAMAKTKIGYWILELEKHNIVTSESIDVLNLFYRYDIRFTFRLIMDVANKLSCFLDENIKYQNIIHVNSIVKRLFEEQCDIDSIVRATGLSIDVINEYYEQYKGELKDKEEQEIANKGGVIRNAFYDTVGDQIKKIV